MATERTRSTGGADDALDATGRNLRQAQQRLATLLAAARLAASARPRRIAAPLAPATRR